MASYDGSIYRTCREAAGLTQEAAAEQLNCSVRALARYEGGEQRTPDDIAYQMAVIYDSQFLALQHLRQVSQVAEDLLPPVTERELSEAAMRIFNRLRHFAERRGGYMLLEIAEDNEVSVEEAPMYRAIFQELLDIDRAILELRVARTESPPGKMRDRSVAGTTKRSGSRACRGQTENDCKYSIPRSRQIASPSFAGEGVSLP